MFVQRLWMDTRRIEHRSSWAWFERGRHDFVGKRAAGGQKEWRRVERSAEDDTEPFGRACGVRLCRVSCVECRMCGWCGRDEKGRAEVACGGACTAVCSAMAQSMRCERFHTRICTITRATQHSTRHTQAHRSLRLATLLSHLVYAPLSRPLCIRRPSFPSAAPRSNTVTIPIITRCTRTASTPQRPSPSHTKTTSDAA